MGCSGHHESSLDLGRADSGRSGQENGADAVVGGKVSPPEDHSRLEQRIRLSRPDAMEPAPEVGERMWAVISHRIRKNA